MSATSASSPKTPRGVRAFTTSRTAQTRYTASTKKDAENAAVWRKRKHPRATAASAARAPAIDRGQPIFIASNKVSLSIQVQRMAAAFPVVGDVFHLFRGPRAKLEIVRHHARALLELAVEQRLHFAVDGIRQQVDSHQVGRTVILRQQVAVDDAGAFL